MEIPAARFRAQCLKLMDRVSEFGEEILITKRGKPAAKLSPVPGRSARSSLGCMSKKGKIVSEIESPS
jgi:prevent-host-death family protein